MILVPRGTADVGVATDARRHLGEWRLESNLLDGVAEDLTTDHRLHQIEDLGMAQQTEQSRTGVTPISVRIDTLIQQRERDTQVLIEARILG